jgi:hypothetical protein
MRLDVCGQSFVLQTIDVIRDVFWEEQARLCAEGKQDRRRFVALSVLYCSLLSTDMLAHMNGGINT